MSDSKLAQVATCFVDLNTGNSASSAFDTAKTIQSVAELVGNLSPIFFKRMEITPATISMPVNSTATFKIRGIFGPKSSSVFANLADTGLHSIAKALLEQTPEIASLKEAFESMTIGVSSACTSLVPLADPGAYLDGKFDGVLDQLVDSLLADADFAQVIEAVQADLLGTNFGEVSVPLTPATVSSALTAIPPYLQINWASQCQYQGNVQSGSSPSSHPLLIHFYPLLTPDSPLASPASMVSWSLTTHSPLQV